jgi:CBS domain-containing protein
MELMSAKRIRHLPVVENNVVLGVISIGDVVKSIIEIQRNNSAFGFLYQWDKIIIYMELSI